MIVHINGAATDVEHGTRLGEVVDGRVPDRRGVAVAIDGEVIPRAIWDETELTDGARLEIVGAVQGG